MEERNKDGVNVKIAPLAEKLLAVASAEGATVKEFAIACNRAQRDVGVITGGIMIPQGLESQSAEIKFDEQCTNGKGMNIEQKIEKILEEIVEDLSKDDLPLMEVQALQSKLNVMSAVLQLSRKIHDKETA